MLPAATNGFHRSLSGLVYGHSGGIWSPRAFRRPSLGFLLILAACAGQGASLLKLHAETDTTWNRKAAAAYLDERTSSWIHGGGAIDHGTFCVSCHTGLPYALARPDLRTEQSDSPVERQLINSVTKRVRLWAEVQPFLSGPTESRGTESVLNALVLSRYDAPTHALGDDTRKALEILWSQQIKTGPQAGAWPWFNFDNEPWEAPDSQYWGATLAALAVGSTPNDYQSKPEIQENVKRLKEYLQRGEQEQSLLNRLSLLWAAAALPGLITPEEQQSIVKEVLALQRPDGGWSATDLASPTWKRHDGRPQETKSDGYATGLAAFVLQQAGVPRTQLKLQAALSWLSQNQNRVSGAWSGYSLNKQRDPLSDVGKFMTDAATAYAVLALKG